MEKRFYHPRRNKKDFIPVFINNNQHQTVTHFLHTAEKLVPALIEDLSKLIPLYTETELLYENKETREFLDEWRIISSSNEKYKPQLVPLKKALLNWARKYNLVAEDQEDSMFLEIGLWAIPSLRDHPESVEDWREFHKGLGRPIPANFIEWSITEVIYFEDDSDDIELAKNNKRFSFDKEMPFIFTPNSENIHQYQIVKKDDEAGDFEEILFNYKSDVLAAFSGDKDKIFGYRGYGWDPRMYSWSEFEKKLDLAYKKYKELYRERTENFMKENGYVEGKEKRNMDHFDWLVRYQIQEWNTKEIADYYSTNKKVISEDTISKALHNTASLVGFKLRGK
ncbi:hypothetical protein [Bacillus cereus]|uniref:hypothetical protein n=1 Tax=Bacillus cereus TaxID=1396 RepID=UPI001F1160F8|nr:hypothetical protein [Bacillus cereus]MCH5460943.1 hypothetical protein [Bacillus cereus]